MTRSRTIWLAALVALVSVALLVPAGSARAAQRQFSTWCKVYPSGAPMTLKPGERCTFFPLPTISFTAGWQVTKPGSGGICAGVTRYPPNSSNVPLDGYGQPTSWQCVSPTNATSNMGALQWNAVGPFGAVGGQATVLNFSSATIKFILELTYISYYA
jgi:hypothetical protein